MFYIMVPKCKNNDTGISDIPKRICNVFFKKKGGGVVIMLVKARSSG